METSKGVHMREVEELNLLLTTKVADLTAEFLSVKAKLQEDRAKFQDDNRCDINFWLAKVQAEKAVVGNLRPSLKL